MAASWSAHWYVLQQPFPLCSGVNQFCGCLPALCSHLCPRSFILAQPVRSQSAGVLDLHCPISSGLQGLHLYIRGNGS